MDINMKYKDLLICVTREACSPSSAELDWEELGWEELGLEEPNLTE